ncbi:MAG: transglutaminase domain-containing protein [Eubacteriales bacterium]|nr:transglutaminase domain-containing protein [Eubacteriales bacterium]
MKNQRKKRRFPWILCLLLSAVIVLICIGRLRLERQDHTPEYTDGAAEEEDKDGLGDFLDSARKLLAREPKEVRELREAEVPETDEGHQEYYFKLLSDEEKRAYREMLNGIRNREQEFYLTISADEEVDRVYHAVLKDHPELFWVHNRKEVYKTTYANAQYCRFFPGYSYTEAESQEIEQAMENGYQEVLSLLPDNADDYTTVRTVYTYLIDSADYEISEHDQSIAGIFWQKKAVCAGYAGAVQYLLERFGIPCIYVEGSVKDNDEGHAWNIVQLDGQYYYVDATNGDQPEFLEGDAADMAEHKTIIYDYLCPFPEEYEVHYTPSPEFEVPKCYATDKNFYVLNQGCFDAYDWQTIYDYCCMRLDNGAAVVRFKFSTQEAFDQAYKEWITEAQIQSAARYYMGLYGLNQVEYHYGILENLKTMYFMF